MQERRIGPSVYAARYESQREWRAANPDKVRATGQRYHENHPGKKAEMFAAWYATVKDDPVRRAAKVAATREWRKRNPDKRRSYDLRREAVERGALESERVDRLVVFERDGYVCWICGEACDPAADDQWRRPSLDHVLAIMDGGAHRYDNLRTAHRRCNTVRGVRRRWERAREKKLGLIPAIDPPIPMPPLKEKPPPREPLIRAKDATVCMKGHPLSGDNLNVVRSGGRMWRRCRECERTRWRAYRSKP